MSGPRYNEPMSPTPRNGDKTRKGPRFKRLNVIAGLLYTLALTIALLYVVPRFFFQAERYKTIVETYVSDSIGAKFTADSMHINLLGPEIALVNAVVARDGKPVVSAKQINVGVYVWESLKGFIKLKDLEVISPVVRLSRGRDGKLALPLSLYTTGDDAGVEPVGGLGILGAFKKVKIKGGFFYWNDAGAPGGPTSLTLRKVDLEISKSRFFGPATTKASGVIQTKGREAEIDIDGKLRMVALEGKEPKGVFFEGDYNITDLPISAVWSYIKPYTPFQRMDAIVKWSGSLSAGTNVGFESGGDVSLSSIRIKYEEAFPDGIKAPKVFFTYKVSGKKDHINVESALFRSGGVELQARGKLGNLYTGSPSLLAIMETNDITIEEALKFIPENALPRQEMVFLRDNVRWGRIALKGLKFEGGLDLLKRPSSSETLRAFSGAVFVSGLSVALDGLTYPFDDINGSVTLKDNNLFLAGVSARYGSSSVEKIDGRLSEVFASPKFDINMKAKLNLLETRSILARKVTSPDFRKNISKVEWMEGEVRLDVNVSGDTKDIASTLAFKGDMSFSDVGMEHASFGLPIKNLDGKVRVNLKDITIQELAWTAGKSPFRLSGRLNDVLGEKPNFDIKLSSMVALEDMGKIKFLNLGDFYHQSGTADIELGVKGTFTDFDLEYRLDMTDAEFSFKDVIRKPRGVKNVFNFSGAVRNNEKVRIHRLVGRLGESSVEITGRIGKFLRGEGVDLTFASDGVLVDDLDQVTLKVLDDIDSGGYISGKFSIQTSEGEAPFILSGGLELENVDFKLPMFKSDFRECNAKFELINNKIFLKEGSGRFGRGKFKVTGSGVLRKEIPEFTLNIDAQSLHLTDFFGKEDGEEKEPEEPEERDDKERPYMDGIWNLNIKAREGTLGMLAFRDLNTSFRYDNKRFHIEPFTFAAYDGKWSWKGNVYLMPEKVIAFESNIIVQDMEMERFLVEGLGKENVISGRLNLRGPINGEGRDMKEIKRSLEGKLEASAGEGVIRRFRVLAKIFSLINVAQYFKLKTPDLAKEGMPFNNITGNFEIKNGVATTRDLLVDSDAMRIMAVGDYDIAENQVLMTVGVMPFVTIDKVISAVPLVGEVLTGKEKSFIASYYEVKGELGDPQVKTVPIESLAAGIAGIFKRLVELPVTTLKKLEKALTPQEKGEKEQNGKNKNQNTVKEQSPESVE